MDPLVSIIMAAYNGEKYIGEAIRSVLDQSYSKWELIVVNDGSSDSTSQIVESIEDKRIKLISQNNQGVSNARNQALKVMTGAFFCFLDCDDLLPKNSIKSRLTIFQEDESLDFVDGTVQCFDNETSNITRVWQPSHNGLVTSSLIKISESCFFGPSWMIKQNENECYSFNENMTHAEDVLFYLSISKGKKYGYTTDSILYYRDNNESAMSNLEGLELGYLHYYRQAQVLFPNLTSDLEYLKKRIRRIMTLSYLSRKKLRRALISFIKLSRI